MKMLNEDISGHLPLKIDVILAVMFTCVLFSFKNIFSNQAHMYGAPEVQTKKQ